MDKKKVRSLILFIAMLLIMSGIGWYIGKPLVQFASEPELFRQWVQSHGIWGWFGYMGMVIVQMIFALLPGEPFEIVAGYAFGVVQGLILCWMACTIGSVFVFVLVKRFGMSIVEWFFSKEQVESLEFLKTSKKRRLLFFIVYMIPGTPKDLLSYFAGLTDMTITQWLFISTVGRFPSIVTSVVGGSMLGDQNYIFSIVVFGFTLIISGMGIFIYNRIKEKER